MINRLAELQTLCLLELMETQISHHGSFAEEIFQMKRDRVCTVTSVLDITNTSGPFSLRALPRLSLAAPRT